MPPGSPRALTATADPDPIPDPIPAPARARTTTTASAPVAWTPSTLTRPPTSNRLPPGRQPLPSRLPPPATAIHDVSTLPQPQHAPECGCTCEPEAADGAVRPERWHFDVDDYVNPVLPPSPLGRLPRLVARFLGFRPAPPAPVGNLVAIVWAFVGVFAAVAAAGVTVGHLAAVQNAYHGNIVHLEPARNPVFSVGIFGAAAVLEFYALDSPYAQPRSVLGGQLVSSVVGVAVAKLAAAADHDPVRRASRRWLAGALSTACATCVMALTGTVHPPGGATALLAVTDNGALSVGWWLVPGVLAGSAVMQAVALVINNIQRRYPLYWWTPEETGQLWKRLWTRWRRRQKTKRQDDDPENWKPRPDNDAGDTGGETTTPPANADPTAYPVARRTSTRSSVPGAAVAPVLVIRRNTVLVPDTLDLLPEEIRFLEALSARL